MASIAEKSKSAPTYKDLEFLEKYSKGICLPTKEYDALIETIQQDFKFLRSCGIMDYSILISVHNRDQAVREEAGRQFRESIGKKESGDENNTSVGPTAEFAYDNLINCQNLAAHSPALGSIQAASEPMDKLDGIWRVSHLPFPSHLSSKVNM